MTSRRAAKRPSWKKPPFWCVHSPASGAVRYMWVGERSAWKESIPSSAGECRLCPGSVYSGGTWQVAHLPGPSKTSLPRSAAAAERSEEHTSELQSRSDLVCRLLLEKKIQ